MAHERLAIVDPESGRQPLFSPDKKQVLAVNGEIYNHQDIRRRYAGKYQFMTGSDCETILALYREKRDGFLDELDGIFAFALYDVERDEYLIARDPIGVIPLYYGYDRDGLLYVASELKALEGQCDHYEVFPPGHVLTSHDKVPQRYYQRDWFSYDNVKNNPTDGEKLRVALEEAVKRQMMSDVPYGVLLSGGLDSSLVCAVAAKKSKEPIKTFSIGMSGDAIDLRYAREVADYIGSEHIEVIIDKDKVLAVLDTVVKILGTFDITTVRASIGMYLVCKAIHENTDIRVLLTGEISDELFGYKYTDFAPDADEFQKESQKRVRELYMYDVLRADRCISVNSLEARVPFGDLDFVQYVMSLDPAIKMNVYGKGKYLLRKAFEGDWLPYDILMREKAAFSDAVGHSMVDYLKEYADGLYSDKEYEERSARYTHARPFTKESLLYREIFEKYYPMQGEMIADFWMPNRNWKGCDVSDPSARVLSNYGDSGK